MLRYLLLVIRCLLCIILKCTQRATENALYYVLLCPLLLAPPAFPQNIESTAQNPKDYVSVTLPYALNFVRDHINLEFDSDTRAFYEDYNSAIYQLPGQAKTINDLSEHAHKNFVAFPLVRSNKFYVFYGTYANTQHVLQTITPYSVLGLNNPALQHYAGLPADARSNDIYLWSPDTPFWYSEYTADGTSLPFRSYFILHLTAVDSSHTTVEAIENNPVVNAGRKLSVDVHGVVHHYDIRDVPPTTRDREYLLYCVNQFIERRIPNRHVFNCLNPEELEQLKQEEAKRHEIEQEVHEQWGR